MNAERAKAILSALANGIDPLTGEFLPADHVVHSPDVIRALYVAIKALDAAESRSQQ